MKVIIAGSRTIMNPEILLAAISHADLRITEVVSGGAEGVDRLGERWAARMDIDITRFPPNYVALGKRAPLVRNAAMADYADALIAIWDGKSRGTEHMIREMKLRGKSVYVERAPAAVVSAPEGLW